MRVACFGASDAELGEHGLPLDNLGVLSHAELAREMNASQVLLCFSLSANISWVPLQGMACGCAVVEADVPGVREMVDDGRTCLLAAPEPDAVAARLLELVADDALRLGIATAAADAMRERSFASSAEQFEAILRERCFARLDRDDGRSGAGGVAELAQRDVELVEPALVLAALADGEAGQEAAVDQVVELLEELGVLPDVAVHVRVAALELLHRPGVELVRRRRRRASASRRPSCGRTP